MSACIKGVPFDVAILKTIIHASRKMSPLNSLSIHLTISYMVHTAANIYPHTHINISRHNHPTIHLQGF